MPRSVTKLLANGVKTSMEHKNYIYVGDVSHISEALLVATLIETTSTVLYMLPLSDIQGYVDLNKSLSLSLSLQASRRLDLGFIHSRKEKNVFHVEKLFRIYFAWKYPEIDLLGNYI
jgi:hypothetical protein